MRKLYRAVVGKRGFRQIIWFEPVLMQVFFWKQGYNQSMSAFHFFHPTEIRYVDLDAQGHVNNAHFLTYFEQARVAYIRRLELWQSDSSLDLGIILANASLTFLAPVYLDQRLETGVRVTRMGNKSLTMEYQLEETESRRPFCTGTTTVVAYNYRARQSIPIPDEWREKIRDFEKLE